MSSDSSRYGVRSNGLNHGDVFTSPEVVKFMLDTIGYTSQIDLSKFYILEPSFGTGEYLSEILFRIEESAKKYHFNPNEAFQKCVYGCELDNEKYVNCIAGLEELYPNLSKNNFKNEDFLLSNWEQTFDFIVGNPPYVRYENIPHELITTYKAIFKTFHYRCDLYVLFYEKSLSLLNSSGKHCFICSNRWLKNEYGKKLRQFVGGNFNLEKLIDVERLDAFQEKVLAYPAISIIVNCPNKYQVQFASIHSIQDLKENAIQYEIREYSAIDDLCTIFHKSQYSSLPTIEEQNFSIGIGVATGADRIFISKDLPNLVENDLLLPIICAKDLSGNCFQYNGLYLLNPYDDKGNLVDLESHPKAKIYLERHRTILQNRHIVRNNRKWYSLIDKVKTGLQHKPKILLPDISANSYIFVDNGNFYPSHNIYYITSDSDDSEGLSLLAAILISDVVKEQILDISNKMNGGFPRWQSQVLRKIKIPYLRDINADVKRKLLSAYSRFNLNEINHIVNTLYESSTTYICRKKKAHIQLSLFE